MGIDIYPGLIERLDRQRPSQDAPSGYGRTKPGRNDGETLRIAARRDRRRRARPQLDNLRGRLIDVQS